MTHRISTPVPPRDFWLTSTQIGAVGEALVACDLMLASNGRLAPFKPIADDDGIDLLVYDKLTRAARPLQIKCRLKFDDPAAQTVQFDVQTATFSEHGEGFVLAALLEGRSVRTAWLVPSSAFAQSARSSATKLTMVPSAKPTSKDRYSAHRHASSDEGAVRLMRHFDEAARRPA
jgi:hypothetical protein